MTSGHRETIPVNIISGPLGVGKTTAINHLLSHRPERETWAVLVNEYGLVGLDGALIADSTKPGGVAVKEVAGGCICCSAGFIFEMSLVLLLQKRPDRLLIEPTGLANVSGILDTLGQPGIRESVEIRSVICLLDPATYRRDARQVEVQDQIEAADIVLASRADLADDDQLDGFLTWARGLFPHKRFVGRAVHGQLPIELLDLVREHDTSAVRGEHTHGEYHSHDGEHQHEHASLAPTEQAPPEELVCSATRPLLARHHHAKLASSLGWVCWEGWIFDARTTHLWLRELAASEAVRRVKAVLRTNEGWWAFNLVDGSEEMWPTGHRRDSRIELVVQGELSAHPETIEQRLRACLVFADGGPARTRAPVTD